MYNKKKYALFADEFDDAWIVRYVHVLAPKPWLDLSYLILEHSRGV